MENYINSLLTEEQLAAYLDGMLSTDESSYVEEVINTNPVMEDILDDIDYVDSAYINNLDEEIPDEFMDEDFLLPDIYDNNNSIEDDYGIEYDNDMSDEYQDGHDELEDMQEGGSEDMYYTDSLDEMSF